MDEKPVHVPDEVGGLAESSPSGGPAPEFAVVNQEGVAGLVLIRLCFEVQELGGELLRVGSQTLGVRDVPSAGCRGPIGELVQRDSSVTQLCPLS